MTEGVCAPKGFVAGGAACGIKSGGAPDLAIVATEDRIAVPAAGVFTTNLACAAPVQVSREHLANGQAAAVVLSSGNANAATGERGRTDARRMTQLTGEGLGVAADAVLVCSTGLIGYLAADGAARVGDPGAVRGPQRARGRGRRDPHHRHGAQGGGRRGARYGRSGRRHGEGCGDAEPGDGHDARGRHDRRADRPHDPRRGAARRDHRHVRRSHRRRVDEHERHGPGAGEREVGRRRGRARGGVHRRAHRRLRFPRGADGTRRRGCHQADPPARGGRRARTRTRAAGGPPGGRLAARAVLVQRRGPLLGSDPLRAGCERSARSIPSA